jgi:hypothetical protein
MTDPETYGDAAERILGALGMPTLQSFVQYIVDELYDVQRATRDAMETGGEG